MTYRPYPDRARALRQVQRTRDAYTDFLYRDVPQRAALGVDLGTAMPPAKDMLAGFREAGPAVGASVARIMNSLHLQRPA